MSQTIASSLLDAALALPPEARAELADILLDSLEQPIAPDVLKAIAEEAERRIDEIDRGETTTISQQEFDAWRRVKWDR